MNGELSKPLAVIIVDGVPHCPNGVCNERLDERGSIYYTIRTYVHLTPRDDGKFDVEGFHEGDPDRGQFCCRCDQLLDPSTLEW
jgi:hypothetical protein